MMDFDWPPFYAVLDAAWEDELGTQRIVEIVVRNDELDGVTYLARFNDDSIRTPTALELDAWRHRLSQRIRRTEPEPMSTLCLPRDRDGP